MAAANVDFFKEALKSFERAKDPLTFAGIVILVIVVWALTMQSNNHSFRKPVKVILYVLLSLSVFATITGLYLKIKPATMILNGQLMVDCSPGSGITVSSTSIKETSTLSDGRFTLNYPASSDTIFLTFKNGSAFIGDTSVVLGETKNEREFKFGNCTPLVAIAITGEIFDGKTKDIIPGASVRLQNYKYQDSSGRDGIYRIKGEVNKKDSLAIKLIISAKGYEENTWPIQPQEFSKTINIPLHKKPKHVK